MEFRHQLIGNSAAMRELVRHAAAAARNLSPVLILGETGTGKELVARAIHFNSSRANGPFVAVNCAAVPEALFESELFGHEKGAFTGAVSARPGEFELAAGGTLFLDEIGELPLVIQAKLLRVLQEREFKRLGGIRTLKADVRIIAATNRNLRKNAFRSDLYYRLNVISIETPSLRDRREDILLLAHHFVGLHAPQSGRPVHGISNDAEDILLTHDWPGNVRELQNAIECAVMMGSTPMIIPNDLPRLFEPKELAFENNLNAAKRSIIVKAFTIARGQMDTAAELLELNRNYLYDLLKKLELTHLRRPPIDGAT
jgi:transcriptional regulator with PAS, ATPase and Fis domain